MPLERLLSLPLTDKNEKQTRTRLAPGSLYLIDTQGSKTPVDITAAPEPAPQPSRGQQTASAPAPTRAAKEPAVGTVEVQKAYGWLHQQLGADVAPRAWAELNVVEGQTQLSREALGAVYQRYAHAAQQAVGAPN